MSKTENTSESMSGVNPPDNSRTSRQAFKVPLFEDPRLMSRKKLIAELALRKKNMDGKMPVLCARLLRIMTEEGLETGMDPDDLDDRQPEKWMHIANLASQEAAELEKNGAFREECMRRSNAWITENVHPDQDRLLDVARGSFAPEGESPLFLALLRFGAALMMEPIVEGAAARDAGLSSVVVCGSVYISQLRTGFITLPEHLSEDRAYADERMMEISVGLLRKKRLCIQHENHSDVMVELGAEVSVDVGGRFVRAIVTRVAAGMSSNRCEDNDSVATVVFARPTSAQFGGPNFEFELDLEEYLSAVKQAAEEVLESVADAEVAEC